MNQDNENPVWSTAWAWVRREHEGERLDAAAYEALNTWLEEKFEHRNVYDKAVRLWHLAGLVAPMHVRQGKNDLDRDASAEPPVH